MYINLFTNQRIGRKKRIFSSKEKLEPGPGSYDPNIHERKTHAIIIGK